jgi:hypothetical protein
LPNGRLLGRTDTALATDRSRLTRLVATLDDIRILIDAWAAAFSEATARDVFESRLHQLLVEQGVDWRSLDSVAASNFAEPLAQWASNDLQGVLAKVPRPTDDTSRIASPWPQQSRSHPPWSPQPRTSRRQQSCYVSSPEGWTHSWLSAR